MLSNMSLSYFHLYFDRELRYWSTFEYPPYIYAWFDTILRMVACLSASSRSSSRSERSYMSRASLGFELWREAWSFLCFTVCGVP